MGWKTRGSILDRRKRFFSSPNSRTALNITPTPIRRTLGVKRTDCEARHSPPLSAEAKNEWSYASTSLAYLLTLHCVNLTFPLVLISSRSLGLGSPYFSSFSFFLSFFPLSLFLSPLFFCFHFLLCQ